MLILLASFWSWFVCIFSPSTAYKLVRRKYHIHIHNIVENGGKWNRAFKAFLYLYTYWILDVTSALQLTTVTLLRGVVVYLLTSYDHVCLSICVFTVSNAYLVRKFTTNRVILHCNWIHFYLLLFYFFMQVKFNMHGNKKYYLFIIN